MLCQIYNYNINKTFSDLRNIFMMLLNVNILLHVNDIFISFLWHIQNI